MPIKKIKDTIKGARETLTLRKKTKANNRASKDNIKQIGIQLAKKNYKEKTGQEMTASKLKEARTLGFLNKDIREYQKDKRTITKAKMKHYGF